MKLFVLAAALAALPSLALAQAQPRGLSDACKTQWEAYVMRASPKAFAASADGRRCGWRFEGGGVRSSIDDAKSRALATCESRTEVKCTVVHSQ